LRLGNEKRYSGPFRFRVIPIGGEHVGPRGILHLPSNWVPSVTTSGLIVHRSRIVGNTPVRSRVTLSSRSWVDT
jgi:hypothetical protein